MTMGKVRARVCGAEVWPEHGKGKVKAAGGVATASPPGECRPSEAFPGSLQSRDHAYQLIQLVGKAGEWDGVSTASSPDSSSVGTAEEYWWGRVLLSRRCSCMCTTVHFTFSFIAHYPPCAPRIPSEAAARGNMPQRSSCVKPGPIRFTTVLHANIT